MNNAMPEPSRRMALRLNDVAATTGLSRRSVERERASGRFPKPDRVVGRMPLWRPETIEKWIANTDNN
jgi:predicted DNA-binding transcriptional regulator AlpA